ncbi:MAG: IS1595 family transposase [Acidobacteriia bacterium]|nr:IS1595 family transposase [Terriglobia bacterium]
METPKTLQEAIQYFADFENCRQFMIAIRWLDGKVRCPECRSEKVTYLEKARLYKCYGKHSRAKFSLKVGTVFEDSPIPLEKWLPAVWMLVNDKNGISSYELHRALGITQKTAWFMLHRIRLGMSMKHKHPTFGPSKLGDGGKGNGAVEVDETFIGGKLKNMHKDRRARFAAESGHAGGATGKAIVQGILDREARQVRAKVVPNVKRETLQNEVLENVKYGTTVYTDDAVPYDKLHWRYVHEVVNHAEEYVRGQVHTNGLENFWSLLKRGLKGTYVAVEPFHLDRYIDEQVFRYNNRATKGNPLNDADRFALAISQVVGKRLTYDELTGKTGERPL